MKRTYFSHLCCSAVFCMLLSPVLLLSQDEFFEIARFEESSYLTEFVFAVNPDTSTIVLSYGLQTPGTKVLIVSNKAKIKKDGLVKFSNKTSVLSKNSINTEFPPRIVFHPTRKQFLVLWRERSTEITDLDIGGRLLNKKGKPIGEPLEVISELFNQGFPHAVAYVGKPENAPAGAVYFILWVELDFKNTIVGQFFDKDVQPLGERFDLETFGGDKFITSVVSDGETDCLISIIANGFDKDARAETTTLGVLRIPFESPSNSEAIILKKDETPRREFAQIVATSDTSLILGTNQGEFGMGLIENYEIKNSKKLGFKKKPYKVLKGELARSQNIIQLDDGRIFQIVLTRAFLANIVVQELTDTGKPKGSPIVRTQPQNLKLLSSQALALPGRNEILLVLSDFSAGAYRLLGTVITIN